MLAIILGILKGIAYLLLGIVLVLFFLIALILASPLKYDIAGEQIGDGTDQITGQFDVSWLFGILHIWGGYKEGKPDLHASVFGISLLDRKKKKKKRRKKKGKQKASSKTKSKQKKPHPPKELVAAEQVDEVPMKAPPQKELQKKEPQEEVKQKEKSIPETMEQTTPSKRMKVSEIEEKAPKETPEEKAKRKAEKKQERAEKKEALKEKKELVLKYWAMFQSVEDKKKIFKSLVKLLKRLMKGILPEDIFIKGTVGLGEPELTGYVLALAGILVGKFGNHIAIKGDFTKFVIEDVRLQIRGRIVFGYLVYGLLAFVLTKPVLRLIGKVRKGMVE
ncbi:hypothetical protein [Chakrabartyella piscis]|uniref:hypothetical protein n=1 Tax=Chakrabartyella piscis TaxID=2918914 RepID=UPI0029584C44|nr:hypothetical protein [Chakrabartyella piscis]